MKAYIFFATGFEEIEAVSVIDVLRRAGVEVEAIAIPEEDDEYWVEGAHDISVIGDNNFDDGDFSDGDILILPGGQPGTDNLNANKDLKKLILQYHEQGKYIAAICAAPLILGGLGLLKGKRAVCYPGYEKQLVGAEIATDERVVVDGKIITSKGPGTAIEFGLVLVELLVGKEVAEKLSEGMIVK
ncbi:thiazole biosynthesis protein ThiJ [Bacteroidia bacterium]|nr:thiazole biosynthesis protein ThiJ [Bacteroidia bacterium]